MSHAICTRSMMPMRAEPRHASEMVNMLLFGDTFEILETTNGWNRISCSHDNYEGWAYSREPELIDAEYRFRLANETPVLLDEAVATAVNNDNALRITFGARLPMFRDETITINGQQWFLNADVSRCTKAANGQAFVSTAKAYLRTPYLWGGRSIFGIDCSGLIQMVFMINGIKMPRDAYQQAEHGINIPSLKEAKAGDLAFFAEKEKISHVGILTGDGYIIHASEEVRIDKIDDQGIFNRKLGTYGLKVKSVRRML